MKIQKDVFSDETLCIRMIVKKFTSKNPSPKVGFTKICKIIITIKIIIWLPRMKIQKDVFSDETFMHKNDCNKLYKYQPKSKGFGIRQTSYDHSFY
jgi:hypothetical protein